MASKGKPAAAPKSTADPIVEQLQRQLKQEGFYAGEIDGRMGDSTKAAVEARDAKKEQERKDQADAETRELRKKELEQSGKKTDADAAEAARRTKAR